MLSPTTHTAANVIALLNLAPLPHEGGWFRRTHEAALLPAIAATATASAAANADASAAPVRRPWSMIHALFTPDGFSALHRVAADELWIYQAGDPLEILRLPEDGSPDSTTLGLDVAAGHCTQLVVPGGVWQGARPCSGGRWTLVTCVVVPEFRWEEFELGQRADLLSRFPTSAETIRRLTRG